MNNKKIAGVVLAGGRSSRMGQDKALLDYNGQSLLDHMIELLKQVGLDDVYVSGDFKGYRSISDSTPHEGPAYAMHDVLQHLSGVDGVLFVPVDTPLLNAQILHLLIQQEKGAYFAEHPLPAFITGRCLEWRSKSVKEFLSKMKLCPLILPSEFEKCMVNSNTPEEWQEVLRA